MSSSIKVALDRNAAISLTKHINVSLVEMRPVLCTTSAFGEEIPPHSLSPCEMLLVLLVCGAVASKHNDVFIGIMSRSMIEC